VRWTGSGPVPTVGRVYENYAGIRRVCVAVEAEPTAAHSVMELAIARRHVSTLLAGLCRSPTFSELSLSQQRTGNTEVIVFPVGIDEPWVLTLLVRWLACAVYRANSDGDGRRLRLKMVVHEGITTLVAGVFDGPAVRDACALVTAMPLRAALAAAPMAELAVLFSGRLRDDLAGFERCLAPGDFTSIELPVGTADTGWLLLPEAII
jgi:hypothetical protein